MSASAESIPAVVLVDYDNIRPNVEERTTKDVAENLVQIREWIATALVALPFRVSEVTARFYGGWNDERGSMTLRGNWMIASLTHVRGLARGVRFLPTVVTSIAVKSLRLKGLYRTNRALPEQKMVDTLMAVDTLHFSESDGLALIVVSDDDDLVPALLAASEKACKACCLLRLRAKGDGINDRILEEQGVHLAKVGG